MQAQDIQPTRLEVQPDPASDITGATQGNAVLIVADDEQMFSALSRPLNERYQIHTSTNVSGTASLAAELLPDLVLLVEHDRAGNTRDVCTQLRSQSATAGIPVVVIADDVQAELRCLAAGAMDFIARPIDAQVLALRIRNQIAMKRLGAHLAFLAGTDPLTGLANRRQFDEAFEREFSRLRRSNAHLSLLMIDIDFFKPYNDTLGHVRGDECLREVAAAIAGVLYRAPDLAVRFGGDEFCGILPETELEGACAVAERIRERVSALQLPHPRSSVSRHVSVSIGVVSVKCSEGQSPSEVVRMADQDLYAAKKAGRNRVVPRNSPDCCAVSPGPPATSHLATP